MDCADMGIQVDLLAEASLADSAAERPFLVMNGADVLLQRAFVCRRVVAKWTNEGLDVFVNVLNVRFKVYLKRYERIFTSPG